MKTKNADGTSEEIFLRLHHMLHDCVDYFNGIDMTFNDEAVDFGMYLEFVTHFEKCIAMIDELKNRYENQDSTK